MIWTNFEPLHLLFPLPKILKTDAGQFCEDLIQELDNYSMDLLKGRDKFEC